MRYIFLTIYFVFFSVIPFSFGNTVVEEYVSQGNVVSERRNLEEARKAYEEALKLDPKNYEALWNLSRSYSDLGKEIQDRKTREAFYQKALDYALQATQLHPEGSKGHLYLSIALGRMAQSGGSPKERIRLSKEIKTEAQKAVELNPRENLAWHILGCWNRELATLNWFEKKFANIFLGGVPKEASVEKAVECFKKAIEINPLVIIHHLELAVTYEKLNQKDLAIVEYQKVLNLPLYHIEDASHQEKARERLKKLM